MAEITLPRWIITNKCMPHGWRTSPKPLLVISVSEMHGSGDFTPNSGKDVFEGWEYRFWAALLEPTINKPKALVLAECRACGNIGGPDVASRRLHYERGGCAKRLCAAYKLLLRDKVCVICNQKTHSQKWGVPLCSSACMQAWCEVESQPQALTDALLLIGD